MKMFNNYSLFKYGNKYSRCHSEPAEKSLFLKDLDYYLPQILQIEQMIKLKICVIWAISEKQINIKLLKHDTICVNDVTKENNEAIFHCF